MMLSTFLGALLPVIILVSLGQFLKRARFIKEDVWQAIDLISYKLLFPVLIIVTLARAPFETGPWTMMAVLILAQFLMGAIALCALPLMKVSSKYTRPAIGSIIQSNIRWNTFIALSIAGSLYGEEGIALISIAAAAMIPTANVLSVYAFIHFGERQKEIKARPLFEMVRNPLIISCIIGAGLNVSGIGIFRPLEEAMQLLAAGSIGLGLLAAGAGINLSALWSSGVRTAFWSAVRLILMPGFAIVLAVLFGIEGMALVCVGIATGVPTAVSGYVLSRQLGGDAELSANLIAVQTVFATFSLPAVYWVTLSL